MEPRPPQKSHPDSIRGDLCSSVVEKNIHRDPGLRLRWNFALPETRDLISCVSRISWFTNIPHSIRGDLCSSVVEKNIHRDPGLRLRWNFALPKNRSRFRVFRVFRGSKTSPSIRVDLCPSVVQKQTPNHKRSRSGGTSHSLKYMLISCLSCVSWTKNIPLPPC